MSRQRNAATVERAMALKLCSLALQYPDRELLAARGELSKAAGDLPAARLRGPLVKFFGWFGATTEIELQREYVSTFDLHKRTGLYLTFYTLGDRRERGLALLRLKKLYRAAGLEPEGGELPDYLPLMLEFAASAAPEHGDLVLGEQRPALELIRLSLTEQGSPYRHVLDGVSQLVGRLSATERLDLSRLLAHGPPQELVGLEPFAPPEVMPTVGARR